MSTAPRPLSGIRILDLSRILAGPFATQLLADLGAEVEKIEPLGGDPTRTWGPPFAADGQSAYFRCANRGKVTRELDLKSAVGKSEIEALLEGSDVVIENFLPRSARELDLEPSELRRRYPRLVVCSIRAFASDTPAAERAGYDFLMQAEAGWMQITGEPDGRPMKVGIALVDVLTGLYAANAIQAALLERTRTGVGRHLEIPLFEAALAGLVNVGASSLLTGNPPRRFGNAHPNIVPYQSFRCSDGEVAIAVGNDRQFAALMRGLGVEPRSDWSTNPGRVKARESVVAAIEAATLQRRVQDVIALCEASEVAAGPIRSVDQALSETEGALHHAIQRLRAPDGSEVLTIGTPIRIDGVRAASEVPPPARKPSDPL